MRTAPPAGGGSSACSIPAAGQRQARVAQRAGDPDVVAGAGGIAAQRLAGRSSPNTVMQMFSGPLVVSPPISSQPCASASANRPREKPSSQSRSAPAGQRQREADRARAHRGQVRQVHGQALWPSMRRIGAGEEMAAFDQHVGRDRHLHAGRRRQQRAIVADAEHGAAGTGALEVLFDEVEFGEHARLYRAATDEFCKLIDEY
jgi:hypothetical protein